MISNKEGVIRILGVILPLGLLLLLVLYIFTISDSVKKISLPIFIILLAASIFYFTVYLTSHVRKLRVMLEEVQDASLEKRKAAYEDIHRTYLKLSERQKKKFYSDIQRLHESIEDHIHAIKQVETIIQKAGKGSLKTQKRWYQKLHDFYKLLPKELKQEYYKHVVHFRERLEHGK